MSEIYVRLEKHSGKVDTLTLTTTGATKALTDTGQSLFSSFPFTDNGLNELRFGNTTQGDAFRTAIGFTDISQPFTVGEGFTLRTGSTGTPIDLGGATFSAGSGNRVNVTGVDLTGLTLATGASLHFEQVATPGTITVTLDGTEFTTSVVGSAALTAASLRTKIGANSKFSVGTGTAGVITITGAVNSNYSTGFDAGATEFSGTFAQVSGYSLVSKVYPSIMELEYTGTTGVLTAKYDKAGTETTIPQASGESLLALLPQTPVSDETVLYSYTKP